MTYSPADFGQIKIPGENFPTNLLIVLISLGVLGSILTVDLVMSNLAQNIQKHGSAFVVNEMPPLAGLETSPNSSNTVDSANIPITSQISSKILTKNRTNPNSLQLDSADQQLDISTAKIDSTVKIPAPESSQQPIHQQPKSKIHEGERASKPDACPPLITFRFASNATNPNNQSQEEEKITQLKNWLHNHPQDTALITGHTSSSGEDEYNLLLSYRRAKAVTSLLMQSGITQNQLKIRAYGEQAPIHGQPLESRLNRRVSLQIESTAPCMHKEDTN